MALRAFQNSWVTWRKTTPQSFLINIVMWMPRTLQAGKKETQHLLEDKPHKVGGAGYTGHAGGCSIIFPAIPLACLGQRLGKDSETQTKPGSSPWDTLEAHLELLLFLQQFKSTWCGAAITSPSTLSSPTLIQYQGLAQELPCTRKWEEPCFGGPIQLGSSLCTRDNLSLQEHVFSLPLQVRKQQIPNYRNCVVTWGLKA